MACSARTTSCRAADDLPLLVMSMELSSMKTILEPASGLNSRSLSLPSKSAVLAGTGLMRAMFAALASAKSLAVASLWAGSCGTVSPSGTHLLCASRPDESLALAGEGGEGGVGVATGALGGIGVWLDKGGEDGGLAFPG